MTSKTPQPERPTALITGSSRGLGLTLADFLAAQGYTLIVTARHKAALAAAAETLKRYGHPVYALPGDVTDALHRHALAEVVRGQGGLDLLVNNASDLGVSPLPALTQYPLERLQALFETNVFAPLGLVQALLTSLAARRGLVVNVSSDAGIGAYPGWGAYGSSKAALDLMSHTLAAEFVTGADGIGVVSVDPGDLQTQMHQAAFPGEDITDRPLPEVTLPFWAWLLGQDPRRVSGGRFEAQGERWELPRVA